MRLKDGEVVREKTMKLKNCEAVRERGSERRTLCGLLPCRLIALTPHSLNPLTPLLACLLVCGQVRGDDLDVGVAYAEEERYDLAEKHLLRASEAGSTEAMKHLALVYFLQDQYDLTEKYLLLATQHGDPDTLCGLAYCYASQGKDDLAEKYLRMAAKQGDTTAMRWLEEVYQQQGKNDAAAKYRRWADEGLPETWLGKLRDWWGDASWLARAAYTGVPPAVFLACVVWGAVFLSRRPARTPRGAPAPAAARITINSRTATGSSANPPPADTPRITVLNRPQEEKPKISILKR